MYILDRLQMQVMIATTLDAGVSVYPRSLVDGTYALTEKVLGAGGYEAIQAQLVGLPTRTVDPAEYGCPNLPLPSANDRVMIGRGRDLPGRAARAAIFDTSNTDMISTSGGEGDPVTDNSYPPIDATPCPNDVYSGAYLTSIRDINHPRTLAWYKANQPDWIRYQADKTTPAYEYIYPDGRIANPIDFQNDAVRWYMFNMSLLKGLRGYPMMTFDNVFIGNQSANGGQSVGVWHGAVYDANGVRVPDTGTWIDQYPIGEFTIEYVTAMADYMEWMHTKLMSVGMRLLANIKIRTHNDTLQGYVSMLMPHCDVFFLEGYPANFNGLNMTDIDFDNWVEIVQEKTITLDGGFFDAMPIVTGSNTLADVPPDVQSAALAAFMLVKNDRSYLNLSNLSSFLDYSLATATWDPAVGAPTEDGNKVANVWQRNYANGFVAVNPSSTDANDVTVPAGTWKDIFGNTVAAGVNSMAAASGLVLVKQ